VQAWITEVRRSPLTRSPEHSEDIVAIADQRPDEVPPLPQFSVDLPGKKSIANTPGVVRPVKASFPSSAQDEDLPRRSVHRRESAQVQPRVLSIPQKPQASSSKRGADKSLHPPPRFDGLPDVPVEARSPPLTGPLEQMPNTEADRSAGAAAGIPRLRRSSGLVSPTYTPPPSRRPQPRSGTLPTPVSHPVPSSAHAAQEPSPRHNTRLPPSRASFPSHSANSHRPPQRPRHSVDSHGRRIRRTPVPVMPDLLESSPIASFSRSSDSRHPNADIFKPSPLHSFSEYRNS